MTYVVLEGGDGCGKSTQAARLSEWLRSRGQTVTHVREPGSTPLAESLRDLLLTDVGREIEPVTEALLFTAARSELLRRTIAPALARGEVVVSERSFVSTMVYQSLAPLDPAQRVPLSTVAQMTRTAHEGLWPTAVVVLDIDVELGRDRMNPRATLDRIESRGVEFATSVRHAFLELAQSETLREMLPADAIHVVDASGSAEDVQHAVRQALGVDA